MTRRSPPRDRGLSLDALELAAGRPLGQLQPAPGGPAPPGAPPFAVLQAALVPLLRRPPCRVAFSGGRDSSLLLAAAIHAARDNGLAPPVAVTMRVPDDERSHETAWQELVAGHLALGDWEHVEDRGDLDLLSAATTPLLRELGPYFPANAHSILPLMTGRGGSLVLGHGGDEVLTPPLWRHHHDVLARRRRANAQDVARAAVAWAPGPVRRRYVARQQRPWLDLPWLTPAAARSFARRAVAESDVPVAYPPALRAEARRRAHAVALDTFARLGDRRGVTVVAPLLDPAFVTALGVAGGRRGFDTRTDAMRAAAGGALPEAVVARGGKASFSRTFYGPATRRFAAEWRGGGLPEGLVDREAVRRAWSDEPGDFRAALLLQSAWLHEHPA